MAARQIVTLQDLGHEGAWLLVQQACGIPEARSRSSFLENMTVLLLFAQDSFPERMCVTAAVRQMSGHVVYVGEGPWKNEIANYPEEMSHITGYYVDCAVCHGLPLSVYCLGPEQRSIPLLNAGGSDAHPAHALADVACMQQHIHDLARARVAWVGRGNGTLNSLMEAMQFFPFSLHMALPAGEMPDADLVRAAQQAGRRIEQFDTPEEAVKNADFICAGQRPEENGDEPAWAITPALLQAATPTAHILLSASPLHCTPIAPELLHSRASLLYKQAEHRLRVNTRIFHWLFSEE